MANTDKAVEAGNLFVAELTKLSRIEQDLVVANLVLALAKSKEIERPTLKVQVVMSTSDHESAYTVEGVFFDEKSAHKFEGEKQAEGDEPYADEIAEAEEEGEEFDTGWHVWIEEHEVKN